METSASVTISTEQKLQNLRTALEEVYLQLRKEGRYISAEHVDVAKYSVTCAIGRHVAQMPGHD